MNAVLLAHLEHLILAGPDTDGAVNARVVFKQPDRNPNYRLNKCLRKLRRTAYCLFLLLLRTSRLEPTVFFSTLLQEATKRFMLQHYCLIIY